MYTIIRKKNPIHTLTISTMNSHETCISFYFKQRNGLFSCLLKLLHKQNIITVVLYIYYSTTYDYVVLFMSHYNLTSQQ